MTFYFGFKAMPNLEEIADNLPKSAWRKLLRPPRYEVKTDPRSKPVNVKQRIVREREYEVLRLKDEDWQTVMDVNLTAAFRLSRAVLRGMMKKRWGRIIGITSIVGVTGNAGQANYAASKAGMIGMSKSLAQEVASRGITVNCLAPGFIATPMTDALTEDQQTKINASIPAGRMGAADEIAAGVAYLASDEAAYITGQTLHINGGMAMI